MGHHLMLLLPRTPVRAYVGALAVAGMLVGCPSGPQLSEGVTLTSDLVYGKGYVRDGEEHVLRDLRFDLIKPTSDAGGNRPAVLMVHGGSFEGGTKTDEDLVALADRLASDGYVCFLIDYRVASDEPPGGKSRTVVSKLLKLDIPSDAVVRAAYVDTKTAMRHIRANASTYGINPNRVAVFGESAGAFAAIAAGVSDNADFASDGPGFPVPPENNPGVDAKPQAVVDCWGGLMFVAEEFDAADPPIMIWHGLFDTTVPYLLAVEVAGKCESAGIPHRLFGLYGEGHGAWDAEWEGQDLGTHVLEFLDTYLPG